jgi:hypothetical protein
MPLNLEEYACEFCGKTCKNVIYAAFVCDDPECIEKARVARGGPGGHMKRKAEGKPIIPADLEPMIEENKKARGGFPRTVFSA